MPRTVRSVEQLDGALSALPDALALVSTGGIARELCARWASGVRGARAEWTRAFGGEQFSLGRAFYTHYEEGLSRLYFDDAAASDARVERHAPGLQDAMRAAVARVTGARAVTRRGWCGPGVHVFPPRGPVADRGGVVHFDIEGLAAHHVAARRRAITVVAVVQAPASSGLRVWDVLYSGRDAASADELAAPSALIQYEAGDLVVLDSYRLHQIQPFDGKKDRISATVHAAEIDDGLWETWF